MLCLSQKNRFTYRNICYIIIVLHVFLTCISSVKQRQMVQRFAGITRRTGVGEETGVQ